MPRGAPLPPRWAPSPEERHERREEGSDEQHVDKADHGKRPHRRTLRVLQSADIPLDRGLGSYLSGVAVAAWKREAQNSMETASQIAPARPAAEVSTVSMGSKRSTLSCRAEAQPGEQPREDEEEHDAACKSEQGRPLAAPDLGASPHSENKHAGLEQDP